MLTNTQILDYCKKYLIKYHQGEWELEISPSNFLWNDDIPLLEIIVKSSHGQNGYLLVSSSKQTPFLITKAFHGDTLTELLLKKSGIILKNISPLNFRLDSVKFYYDPPFNFIVKNTEGYFIDLKDNFFIEGQPFDFYLPPPTKNAKEIENEWLTLEQENVIEGITEIIHRSGPRYNQTYDSKCEISGCSPVGWACYAGWLKMSGLLPLLFNNSEDWFNDWPSYIFPCDMAEEQSKSVHELIWWFNKIMGTQNGSTLSSNIIKGGALFAKFGNPNIKIKEFRDCNINTVTSLLSNYAILFGGFREWQTTNLISPELQARYSAPAGHSVVCHGVKGNEIYVNMGWGDYVESRWYNINSITQRHCFGLYS
jgi:hypothetical protein